MRKSSNHLEENCFRHNNKSKKAVPFGTALIINFPQNSEKTV